MKAERLAPIPKTKMAKRKITSHIGPDAYDVAHRMAKYGHCDWAVWRSKNGELKAAKVTSAVIKEALLAVGVKGRFSILAGSNGHTWKTTWRIGILRFMSERYYEKHGQRWWEG